VMDGYQAATNMRKAGRTRPIVALTANAMKGDEAPILAAGFSHYQTKPIDLDALASLLASLLGGEQVVEIPAAQKESEQLPKAKEESRVAETIEDPTSEPLVSTLAQRDARFRSTVDDFVMRCQKRALLFDQALEVEDYAGLADLAHWLKGSGGTVGFAEFEKPSRDLEKAAIAHDRATCESAMTELHALWQRLPAVSEDTGNGPHATPVAGKVTKSSHSADDVDSVADTPVISELIDRDPRMAAIVDQFMDRLSSQMGAMRHAIEEERYGDVADLAHWLKGSGGNVGFPELGPMAAELQMSAKNEDSDGMRTAMSSIAAYAERIRLGRDPVFLSRSA